MEPHDMPIVKIRRFITNVFYYVHKYTYKMNKTKQNKVLYM